VSWMNSLADLMSLLNFRMRFADFAQLGFMEMAGSPSRLYQGMSLDRSFRRLWDSPSPESDPDDDPPSSDSSPLVGLR